MVICTDLKNNATGFIQEIFFIIRCKYRGINSNDPTPSPPLEGEGGGGEVIKY